MPLISIIIPVYNLENYIERTLRSILHQSVPQDAIEVIVINDGSTDRSLQQINTIAATDSRVRVFSRENGGQAAARNQGIRLAESPYLMFVDGDDWLEPDVLALLLPYCEQKTARIIGYETRWITPQGRKGIINRKQVPFYRLMTGREYLEQATVPGCLWSFLFSADLLLQEKLCLCEGMTAEDEEFVPRVFFFSPSVIMTDILVYNYNLRPDSCMRSPDREHQRRLLEDRMKCLRSLRSFAASYPQEHTKGVERKIAFLTVDFIRILFRYSHTYSYRRKMGELLIHENFLPLPAYPYSLKYTIFRRMIYGVCRLFQFRYK